MTLPSSPASAEIAPAMVTRTARSWRGLAKRLLLSLVVFILFGELLARGICWCRKAPILSTDCLWYVFYPQLRTTGVDRAVVSNTDETYDVLMVGGSTISDGFGCVSQYLKTDLETRLARPVRVFNLAASCHNSRDSVLKCRRLAHQHFDLVIVYDGINDTRMNNAPPDQFRDDYSHCIWYKHLNNLERHPRLFQAALPFMLLYTEDCVAEFCGLTWFVPPRDATPELLEFGKDIRTRRPFQNHLQEIVTLARNKGERVVLMTFAGHVPANYSLEAYRARVLDYYPGGHTGCPVEVWGNPENVLAALEQHNEAVRELVALNPEVVFIDQESRMTRSAQYFTDCCHLTAAGCRQFTDNILRGLEAAKVFSE